MYGCIREGSASTGLVASGIQGTIQGKEKGAENIYICKWEFLNFKKSIKTIYLK